MSSSEPATTQNSSTKKPVISLKFTIVAAVLCVGGYFGITWGMTQYMLWEEQNRDYSQLVTEEEESEGGFSGGGGGRGPGGGGEGRRGGGRGGDPEAFFARLDGDENGIIEGEEIRGRMAERIEQIDTDADGKVSKEEFLAGFANRQRGGQARGNQGGERAERPQRPTGSAAEASEASQPNAEQNPSSTNENESSSDAPAGNSTPGATEEQPDT